MAERKVNYTEAQVASMIERYQAGENVETLAEAMGKSVRSVIAKLVREGVYVAAEKPKARKIEGPTKKEMLLDLERRVSFDVTGLMGATKEAIQHLIDAFPLVEAETDAETDAEADAGEQDQAEAA
jgi:hypothetical protein